MLVSCVFYLAYIFSAFKSNLNWPLALSNLAWPHGIHLTQLLKLYAVIGLGVLVTTITPLGPVLYQ